MSADPAIRLDKASIKDFLLKVYEPLGVTKDDFNFKADVDRSLLTGLPKGGGRPPARLEPMKVEQAKVNPPETIFEAAARHLRRFGLMHWDTPDGKVYIGAPDDKQAPVYRFVTKRVPNGGQNNLIGWTRIADWIDVPSDVTVFGATSNKDGAPGRIEATAGHLDVLAAGFNRPVYLPMQQLKTLAQAESAARREVSARSMRKDAYELLVDGWAFWNGSSATPYATNTTADVDIDATGGAKGKYFVHRVSCRSDAQSSKTTSISLVAQGIFDL